MRDVCTLLEGAWSLRVLCPCGDLHALGVAMERRGGHGNVYVHPSAMNLSWQLKQSAPLQSAWAVTETSLGNLFFGVLMNCRDFMSSCSEYLLSAAAWLQISFLCDHTTSVAVRACQKAIHRFLSYTPHDAVLSHKGIEYISRYMPCDNSIAKALLWMWLQQHAVWDRHKYASRHMLHMGEHTALGGDWSLCRHVPEIVPATALMPPAWGPGEGAL